MGVGGCARLTYDMRVFRRSLRRNAFAVQYACELLDGMVIPTNKRQLCKCAR